MPPGAGGTDSQPPGVERELQGHFLAPLSASLSAIHCQRGGPPPPEGGGFGGGRVRRGIKQGVPFPRPRRRPPRAAEGIEAPPQEPAGQVPWEHQTKQRRGGTLRHLALNTDRPGGGGGSEGRNVAVRPGPDRHARGALGAWTLPPAPGPATGRRRAEPPPSMERTSSPPAPPGGSGARPRAPSGGRSPDPGARPRPAARGDCPAPPPRRPAARARSARGRPAAARARACGPRRRPRGGEGGSPGGRARPLGRPGLGGGWPPARPLPVPLPTAPGTPGEGEAGFAGRGRAGGGDNLAPRPETLGDLD